MIEYNNGFKRKGGRNVYVAKVCSEVLRKIAEPVIPGVKSKIREKYGVDVEVRLYGSVANNMAYPGSDIDLLVLLNKEDEGKASAIYFDLNDNHGEYFGQNKRITPMTAVKADNEVGFELRCFAEAAMGF